jgi:hypothetical protein
MVSRNWGIDSLFPASHFPAALDRVIHGQGFT